MSGLGQERPSCACLKTKCVQCKCLCFRARYYCSEKCQCLGCRNTERDEAFIKERVQLILKQRPHVFGPKDAFVQEETTQIPAAAVQETNQVFVQSYSAAAPLHHSWSSVRKNLRDIRCSCQKIKCSYMKCECIQFRVGCSRICKCKECANSFGIKGNSSIIENCVDKTIESEKYDTGGITSEAIMMEEDGTDGLNNEAIRTENPTI